MQSSQQPVEELPIKKPYSAPKFTEYGRIEDITGVGVCLDGATYVSGLGCVDG